MRVRANSVGDRLRLIHLRRAGWLFVYDIGATFAASLAALIIRFETFDLDVAILRFMPAALLPLLLRPATYLFSGLYRREWRYASLRELRDVLRAIVAGSALILAGFGAFAFLGGVGTNPFPRSFFLLEPLFSFVAIAGMRIAMRVTLERRAAALSVSRGVPDLPSLVYGAGEAGVIVGRLAISGELPGVSVVGYLDDDERKQGSRLLGHRVYGTLKDLETAVARSGASQLIVAIPSSAGSPVRQAVMASQRLNLVVKTVPPLRDLVTGGIQFSGVRPVSVEDLLRREPVEIDVDAIANVINDASVLVTGGGGSIGGELVRQIVTLGPRLLTIVDYHEWALWTAERDVAALRKGDEGVQVVSALADVRSASALEAVLRRAKPDVVFHAAALKHVPYVELFPSEGVLTNLLGTRNVLRLCDQLGVSRFVLVSTDKAVEPVSVMGGTKRLAELLVVVAGQRSGKPFAAVRFGNVLGSSGSVVPLLQRQLDDGLPLTITQPDATRFFMTLGEAVSLILEAASDARAGDVYVLEMGEPVRIIDLARDLVRLNGIDPDAVNFTVTGLRPGERLHEKLFYDDEARESTSHPGILRASRRLPPDLDSKIDDLVDDLERAAYDHDEHAVRLLLRHSLQVAAGETDHIPIA